MYNYYVNDIFYDTGWAFVSVYCNWGIKFATEFSCLYAVLKTKQNYMQCDILDLNVC